MNWKQWLGIEDQQPEPIQLVNVEYIEVLSMTTARFNKAVQAEVRADCLVVTMQSGRMHLIPIHRIASMTFTIIHA